MKILITGCSSGFGKLTAEALAAAGHDVFATMRNTASSNAAAAAELRAHPRLQVFDLDVSDDDSVQAGVGVILAEAGGLDVVVNNAGVAGLGFLEGYSAAKLRSLFEVNVFGAQRVCRATLPALRDGGGLLVFVSSTMGRVVVPCAGAYTASKFALEALAESYGYELAGHGVEVSIVQPGTHPTAIGGNMSGWGPDDGARVSEYGPATPLPAKVQGGIIELLSSPSPPDSGAVSRTIVDLVAAAKGTRPRRIVVDDLAGAGPRAINETSAQVQSGMLEGMGLSKLCALR